MSRRDIDSTWKILKKFAFVTLFGWLIGIPLLFTGLILEILPVTVVAIVLLASTLLFGVIVANIYFFWYVSKRAKEKRTPDENDADSDPIRQPEKQDFVQEGNKEKTEYLAEALADTVNLAKIASKKEKIISILFLIAFFGSIGLFIAGGALWEANIKPLAPIFLFTGGGIFVGTFIVVIIAKSVERIKFNRLNKNTVSVEVYEKEATVLQSVTHSAREYTSRRYHILSNVMYSVHLDCGGEKLIAHSNNYYECNARVKIYIDAENPKDVYMALDNLINPIVVDNTAE